MCGQHGGLHVHAARESTTVAGQALIAAVAWLVCSCRDPYGGLPREGLWSALVDHTILEAAVVADDAVRAEEAALRHRTLVAHMLPIAPRGEDETAGVGAGVRELTDAAPAGALSSEVATAYVAAKEAVAEAAESAGALVLQVMTKHWLPALQHAAAAGGACAASEGLWEEASELCSSCCVGWSRCGWLSTPPLRAGGDGRHHREDAVRESARAAWEGCVLLNAQIFCQHAHVCCLASLVEMLTDNATINSDMPGTTVPEGLAAVAAAPHLAAALAAVLNAAAALAAAEDTDAAEDACLPSLRLAEGLVQHCPGWLCTGESALDALWALAVTPFDVNRAAAAECRDAGLSLLRGLLLLAQGSTRSPGSIGAHGAAVTVAVAASLRPRVPSLVFAMASAIAHAAPTSAVEPASRLLHTAATTFPAEWVQSMPAMLERLAADLEQLGRPLLPQAQKLLLCGALKRPLPEADVFAAMWNDLAQVTRVGMSARALERYS